MNFEHSSLDELVSVQSDQEAESPVAIYPLVSDSGNRRVLIDWLADKEEYTVIDPDSPLEQAEFDLCIVDDKALERHSDTLRDRKNASYPVLLPVLLLLPERREEMIAADQGQISDSVFATTVDEIMSLPIRQVELEWRLQALLRLRRQSIELTSKTDALRQFREAVEASGHAIFITDPEGTIHYANPAFEDVTGYSPSEAIGETPNILNSGEMSTAYFTELWATIKAGEVWDERVINRRKNGSFYTAQQTIAPITDDDGEIKAFVAVQTDVTDLENRTRQLGVIDTILRHNLRNYLTSIRGTAELITTQTSGDTAEAAEEIVRDADGLLSTGEKSRAITEVLSKPPTVTAVEIETVVRSAVEAVSRDHQDVQITVEVTGQPVATATGKLELAIEEILTNAIIHNDREKPEVTVRGRNDGANVAISVIDNGPGLTEMDQDVLETGAALDDLHHGSGLGLWLVYWIVTRSGGSITVSDRTPRGAIVTMTLPSSRDD